MKKEFLKFIILLMVAIGSGPLSAQVYKWSKVAANNATADPNIDWSEGQSPSSINDSARAMMSAVAGYRDDISGLLATGGTATAFTVTTNQGLNATPNDGQMLAFRSPNDNGSGVTLKADGGTAFPIVSVTSTGVVPLPAGTLIAGNPYTVMFSAAISSWEVHSFYGAALTVPLGAMLPYTGSAPPNSNFIFPAGQCLSTTTYANYWVLVGSPASGSCPGGQFAVVDLRGRVPVALDNLNGTAANRLTSSGTGCGTAMTSIGASCANGTENKTLTLAQIPTGITSAGGALGVTGATTVNLLYNGNVAQNLQGGTTGFGWSNNPTVGTAAVSGATAAQSVTSNNTGGGAHSTGDPNIAVTYILRVL